jgi:hypothetical protein
MALNYIPEAHRMVMVYDEDEGGYCVLAHNLAKHDGLRLATRLRDQYDLDAHVICHRVRHDVSDAGDCKDCHAMIDDIIEDAQGGGAITTVNSDDGGCS